MQLRARHVASLQGGKITATVLLVGDGGDDVFLGYPEYGIFLKAERLAGLFPARWPACGRAYDACCRKRAALDGHDTSWITSPVD